MAYTGYISLPSISTVGGPVVGTIRHSNDPYFILYEGHLKMAALALTTPPKACRATPGGHCTHYVYHKEDLLEKALLIYF
jgi:hypothetical protein